MQTQLCNVSVFFNFQAQISTCQDKIKALEEYGEKVLRIPGDLSDEVRSNINSLSQMSKSMEMSWQYRLTLLTQYRDIQVMSNKIFLTSGELNITINY